MASISTSTFELYSFSEFFEHHKVSFGNTDLYILYDYRPMRHSGYRLVETITTKYDDGKEDTISYKVCSVEVEGKDEENETPLRIKINSETEGKVFSYKNETKVVLEFNCDWEKKQEFDYKQTKVIFNDNDPDKIKATFAKIVQNAELINSLKKGILSYEAFNNNCNSWTTYIKNNLLKEEKVDLSHIGLDWNKDSSLAGSKKNNPLSQEVARIFDEFNKVISSPDCPIPYNPHWDETRLAAGIYDLRFGLEGRDHIITNERNLTLEKTVRREDESEEAFQERANKEVVLSLVTENYHFTNKRDKVNVFTGSNEGKIANSGNNCFLATGTGADHILNTGDKVEIYSGSEIGRAHV